MQSFKTRHEDARFLNQVIDRALFQATKQHRAELLSLAKKRDIRRLAERIRQRATWLGRHERQQAPDILSHRDDLIMALYADQAPEGWANAWCDGSSNRQTSGLHAGVGTVLLNAGGKCISQTSLYVNGKTAFEAELTALTAVLDIASTRKIDRLRVHTDSKALVQLWYAQREDPRLAPVRSLSSRFKRLDIRAIPRLHNQIAHSLAKRAISDMLDNP
jgi:ribonuclease HI